ANFNALDLYYQGIDFYHGRGSGAADARSAELAFARATEEDPGFAAAWAGLAQARSWQIRVGLATDTTAARQALDRAVALAPEERETALAQGQYLYYAKGDFQAATDHLESALRSWPEDVELLTSRALILRRLGRWQEALDSLQRAHDSDLRNPDILENLAQTLGYLRRYDEAERYYDQQLALTPDAEAPRFSKIFIALYGRGDTLRTRRLLGAWIDPRNKPFHASLVATLGFFERDYDGGLAALEGLPVDPYFPVDGTFRLALLSRWAGREEASRAWADSLYSAAERMIAKYRAVPGDPFGPAATHISYRGLAHALSGRFAEAVRDGRRGAEMLPLSKDAIEAESVLDNLATIYVLVGDRDAALAVLDTLVSNPSSMGAGRLRLDPTYDSLRGDPRFDALIRKAEAAERSGTGTR
ncbi:MAG: tetratricopeptide repeat protein, partial [Gemmatimonadota bacterium]